MSRLIIMPRLIAALYITIGSCYHFDSNYVFLYNSSSVFFVLLCFVEKHIINVMSTFQTARIIQCEYSMAKVCNSKMSLLAAARPDDAAQTTTE